jgi:hypothetical protein
MTAKEFVLSVYPEAFYTGGVIYMAPKYKLWKNSGPLIENCNDPTVINNAWQIVADAINRDMIKRLES